MVAPGCRVVTFFVCLFLAVGKVRELALCLGPPSVVLRAAQGGTQSPASLLFTCCWPFGLEAAAAAVVTASWAWLN